MRIWITTLEDYDPGNGETEQRPAGIPITQLDTAWAIWPIVDDDDDVPVTNQSGDPFYVVLAKDVTEAPTQGRDFGDPTLPAYYDDALPRNALDTIEDWIGLERGELHDTTTRAEAIRAITQDQFAAIGCTWGPEKVGARCWKGSTRKVRRWRRSYEERTWFSNLTLAQRNGIRGLHPEVQDVVLDYPPANRINIALALNALTTQEQQIIVTSNRDDRKFVYDSLDSLNGPQKLELFNADPDDRRSLIESWA